MCVCVCVCVCGYKYHASVLVCFIHDQASQVSHLKLTVLQNKYMSIKMGPSECAPRAWRSCASISHPLHVLLAANRVFGRLIQTMEPQFTHKDLADLSQILASLQGKFVSSGPSNSTSTVASTQRDHHQVAVRPRSPRSTPAIHHQPNQRRSNRPHPYSHQHHHQPHHAPQYQPRPRKSRFSSAKSPQTSRPWHQHQFPPPGHAAQQYARHTSIPYASVFSAD